jgi:hypothetical protein
VEHTAHAAPCPDCGVGYGQSHWPQCAYAPSGRTGSGVEAVRPQARPFLVCRQRGWAVVHVPGAGFRPCDPGEPGSYHDLDRYAFWLEHGDDVLDGNERQAPEARTVGVRDAAARATLVR